MTRIDTAMALRCGGLTALLVATAATGARAQAQRWPREIPGDPVTVVIYQPQPDSLVGNKLYGRAAMSLERKGQEPIFGVFWMTAQIQTDRDTREARVTGVDVTDVRWPDAKPDQQKRFSDLVEKEVPKWDLPSRWNSSPPRSPPPRRPPAAPATSAPRRPRSSSRTCRRCSWCSTASRSSGRSRRPTTSGW